jgi:phosphatidylglycerophosphate synthase
MTWKTKPTDRFVLRFVKIHLSTPFTTLILRFWPRVRPGFLTLMSACFGVAAGVAFGLGWAWAGGLLAAVSQVLDGVDGQVARLTQCESPQGAFLDSVLDRYADFALLFGMLLHGLRFSSGCSILGVTLEPGLLVLIAALAAAGSSQVSYTTARAASLNLAYRRPEAVGKGTRTAVIVLSGLLTPLWVHFPLLALVYLAIHPNAAVLSSLVRTLTLGKPARSEV